MAAFAEAADAATRPESAAAATRAPRVVDFIFVSPLRGPVEGARDRVDAIRCRLPEAVTRGARLRDARRGASLRALARGEDGVDELVGGVFGEPVRVRQGGA